MICGLNQQQTQNMHGKDSTGDTCDTFEKCCMERGTITKRVARHKDTPKVIRL